MEVEKSPVRSLAVGGGEVYDALRAALFDEFEGAEEEEFVAVFDEAGDEHRAADVEAGRGDAAGRLRQADAVVEELVGVHPFVAVIPVGGTVEGASAAFGDGHDAGGGFAAEFGLVIGGDDADGLDGIEADEVVAVAAVGVFGGAAVDGDAVAVGAAAVDVEAGAAGEALDFRGTGVVDHAGEQGDGVEKSRLMTARFSISSEVMMPERSPEEVCTWMVPSAWTVMVVAASPMVSLISPRERLWLAVSSMPGRR